MFNPIEASNNIKQSFIDYISTSFSFADPQYRKLFREELNKQNTISKGPYLDMGSSFESGHSLFELTEIGVTTKLFLSLESGSEEEKELKIKRPLYSHQEQALLRACAGNNLVVTTGTGSGKTECFLLPILQALLEEKAAGTLTRAVRAIIIYPMNALANDQMKRLRKLLATCPEIYFGLYNGNTRHRQNKAYADYRSLNKTDPLPNEVISREVMQTQPPHILITNYSMLEYMMLRPKDDNVFSGAQLRYIVLDEAHIYRGATGMETSLLMRRLKARITEPGNVQYILTSATLGDDKANSDIVAFAETLCNAPFKAENIIRSREIHQQMIEDRDFPMELFRRLYEEEQPVSDTLKAYDADFAFEKSENEKIFELLLRSSIFRKLRAAAAEVKNVSRLANEIGITEEDLVSLIAVSSKAIKDGVSLVKARYHFFLRALEGAYITLTEHRELSLTRLEHNIAGNPVFECAICDGCGRISIAGELSGTHLFHPRQGFDDHTDYFLIKSPEEKDFFDYDEDDEKADEQDVERSETGTDEYDYVICPTCGAIEMESYARNEPPCEHNFSNYIKIRKARKRNSGGAACPSCEFGNFRRFYLGYEAATAVIGTALYKELPDLEISYLEAKADEKNSFFGKLQTSSIKKIEKARQFLTFSDSRADAAFFACYMEKSYQEFLRRRGLWQMCDKFLAEGRGSVSTRDMINALARVFEDNGTFVELGKEAERQTDICRKHAYIAVINELVSSRRSSGLVQLGKMAYSYAPKAPEKKENWGNAVRTISGMMSQNSDRDADALLNLLMTDVVYAGALDAGDEYPLTSEEREYLFFAPTPKKIVKIKPQKGKGYITGWLPRKRTGEKQSYYPSTRLKRVVTSLGLEENTAWDLLDEFWNNILGFEAETEYSLPIQDFDINLYDSTNMQAGLQIYRCKKCGRVTVHNCQDLCTNIRCSGKLEKFDPVKENSNNHYVNLYSEFNMKPLYIKEHTAQLSRDHAAEYQKLFIEKKINALSSSTTFEMGVDVGSLETVFLRDVPPTPANYVQRAGRAGRSLQSAAYALTYAKLSSHDFTYFKHPEDMISGRIKAPAFRVENEKVIRRHINAIALSMFLAQYEEVYDGDNQSELLNSDGYEKLKRFLQLRPERLKNLLIRSIPNGDYGISNWSWTEHLIGEQGLLELAVQDFRETVAFLEGERKKCHVAEDYRGASSYDIKLKSFRGDKAKGEPKKSLIDFLVRNNILPKYGFPVDTVELLPDATITGDDKRPQMQRDLQLAVAEYAPGSEIVADGKLYTSRYIRKLQSKNTHNWEYGWFTQCPMKDCETVNFYKADSPREDLTCISCGTVIPKGYWQETIEPRRGFIAEKPVEVKMRKPERTYRTEDHYMGDVHRKTIDKRSFIINDHTIQIESTSNDSLVVLTRSTFSVCKACGYAVGEDEEKSYDREHKNAYGYNCVNVNDPKEYLLSHDFKTDVVRITFETVQAVNYDCMLSVLFALIEAVSAELDIERNDIKGCLYKTKWNGLLINNIILYDAVAGGAGHVRRLVTPNGAILMSVIQKAIKMMEGCDCDPSCYKCLRNYYNQKIHDKLDRKLAASFLNEFTGQIVTSDEAIHNTQQFKEVSNIDNYIIESTSLRGDYTDWSDASVLFEEYEGLIETLGSQNIPLADCFEIELQIEGLSINAILSWKDKNLIICENLSLDEVTALENAGLTYLKLDDFNISDLSKLFGGKSIG